MIDGEAIDPRFAVLYFTLLPARPGLRRFAPWYPDHTPVPYIKAALPSARTPVGISLDGWHASCRIHSRHDVNRPLKNHRLNRKQLKWPNNHVSIGLICDR